MPKAMACREFAWMDVTPTWWAAAAVSRKFRARDALLVLEADRPSDVQEIAIVEASPTSLMVRAGAWGYLGSPHADDNAALQQRLRSLAEGVS
jgi:hypothetical protein